jgi:hypothetical protein
MWQKLWEEIALSREFIGSPTIDVVSEAELMALPPPARGCMRFHGVSPGQRKCWSIRMGWRGRFRLGPEGHWMSIEAVQYNTRRPVARLFHMQGRLHGIPVLARDTYIGGRGRLLARMADLVPVADGAGPEFDQGELVTWVNDAVLFAPSMLLAPTTVWSSVDARAFDVTFSDSGCSVTARVFTDDRGAPVDFETTDRYLNDPDDPKHPLIRGRWRTPVGGWQQIDGRMLPARGCAGWRLATREFTYAEFELDPASVAFDEAPGVDPARSSSSRRGQ